MSEEFFANTLVVSLTVVLLKNPVLFCFIYWQHWPFIVNKYLSDENIEAGIAQFFNFVNIWAAGKDNLCFKTCNFFVAKKRISSSNKFFDQFVTVFRKSFLERFGLTVVV